MLRASVAFLACLRVIPLVSGSSIESPTDAKPPFRGRDALDYAPLIDGHNDLAYNLYLKLNNELTTFKFEKNLTEDSSWGRSACPSCHTDLVRLRAGKVGGQFWVAYASCESQYRDAVQLTLRQIDAIKRLIGKYPNDLELVTRAADIEAVWRTGKIASIIAVEGGHSLDSSLAVLRIYHELGVRYVTLTHSCDTPWADASPANEGSFYNLTGFGKNVVHEMNRLGMIVDLSHVSHNAMRHVLAVTKAPVVFSHSSAFGICNNYRNVPDDALLSLKRNDGIVMINFYSSFVNCDETRNATLEDVVDHINYVRNLIGVEHVGIGADYDGVSSVPEGLDDVSGYPRLFDRLHENRETEPSWSRADLEKLAGRNLIRVFSRVETVRDSLASERPRETVMSGRELYDAQNRSGLKPGECQTALEWKDANATVEVASSASEPSELPAE